MKDQLFDHLPFVSLSIIASAMSLMFCIILWSKGSNHERYSKILLIVYLLAVSFRLLKWFYNFLPQETHQLFWNLSFAVQLLLGPLANIYLNTSVEKFQKLDLLHFIPSILMLLFINRYDSQEWGFGDLPLLFIASYWLLHSLWGVYFVFNNSSILTHNKKWLLIFALGNLVISIVYFFYAAVPFLIESIFPLSFMVVLIVFGLVFYQTEGHKNLIEKKIRNKELPLHFDQKLESFLNSKEYLNLELSLNDMAKKLNVQSYQLSQILNDQYGQSFSEFINKKRIDEACRLLKDPKNNNIKIASLAIDCGFNTLSAFNTSFKKFTGTTPSDYKKG